MTRYIDLTPSVDSVSGNHSTFVGTLGGASPTLNAGDEITARHGTLQVTDSGTGGLAVVPAIDVSGVQSAIIDTGEGVTVDSTTWLGLRTLDVASSDGIDHVTAGAGTAIAVADSSGDIYTYGGSTVSLTSTGTYGSYVEVHGGAGTTRVAISGGYDEENYIYDTAGTITTVAITNQVDYDTYIYDNALTTLNLTGITYHYVYCYAGGPGAGVPTLNVALNGNGIAPGYAADYWYFQDDFHTSINFASSGLSSRNMYLYAPTARSLTFKLQADLSFYNGAVAGSGYLQAPNATSLTINGTGSFTADLAAAAASAAVDATAARGAVTVELAAGGGQSFSGGMGRDVVTIGGSQTALVSGGSNSQNEIVLNNASGATQASIDPSVVRHFSVLGVSGSTSGTFDLGSLGNYKSFEVQGEGGDVSFQHAASAALAYTGSSSHLTTVQTSDSTASSDHATLTVGTALTGGIDSGVTVLEDSTGKSIGNVAVESKGNGSGTNHVQIGGNASSTITLTGAEALDLVVTGAGNNTIIDHTAGTGAAITLGTGYNRIDLAGHAGSFLQVGTDAGFGSDPTTPSVVVGNAVAGDALRFAGATVTFQDFGSSISAPSAASLVQYVEQALVAGTQMAISALFDGNTYIVASKTGTLGPNDTFVVELTGVHTFIQNLAGDLILQT